MTVAVTNPSSTDIRSDPCTEGAAAGRVISNGLPPPVMPICELLCPAVATADVELELERELLSVLVVLGCSVVVVTFFFVDVDVVSAVCVLVELVLELELSSVVVLDTSVVLNTSVVLDTSVVLVLVAVVSVTLVVVVVVAAAVVVSVPDPVSNPHRNVFASPTKKCPINDPPLAFCPAHALCIVLVTSLSWLKQSCEHWLLPPLPRNMSAVQEERDVE